MKNSDKAIMFGVLVAALAIGFYILVLGPKRDQASKLNDQIDQLHASISEAEQTATFGEDARQHFPVYYGRLVSLGKAVPGAADTSSLLVQLNSAAGHTRTDLRSIELAQGGDSAGTGTSSAPAPTTTPPSTTPAPSGGSTATPPSGSAPTPATPTASAAQTNATASTPGAADAGSSTATSGSTATSASTLVPATEASAATMPVGAVVGPAGLPTLPYSLGVRGSFFDVANFIGGMDDFVKPKNGGTTVSADGRLMTVDGFSLNLASPDSTILTANLAVTTYVAPSDQGLTAGASPTGPAPASPTQPSTQPTSAVVTK